MRAEELRALSADELEAKVAELRGDLFSARVKKATGQLENTARLVLLRKDVARLETVLREKRGARK